MPFCDMTLSTKDRVADYVKRVNLHDKSSNMHNGATGQPTTLLVILRCRLM